MPNPLIKKSNGHILLLTTQSPNYVHFPARKKVEHRKIVCTIKNVGIKTQNEHTIVRSIYSSILSDSKIKIFTIKFWSWEYSREFVHRRTLYIICYYKFITIVISHKLLKYNIIICLLYNCVRLLVFFLFIKKMLSCLKNGFLCENINF